MMSSDGSGKRLHTPDGTPPRNICLTADNHAGQVLANLYQLFKEGQMCDYTILAEGQSFKTHRNLLASVSDYFRVMLSGSLLESRQDHVELKGVSANAVSQLLEFVYSGKLVLNLDVVMEVLAGACHLQMHSAVRLCSLFLRKEISSKTAVDIMNMAEMFTLIDVQREALAYVTQNFDKLLDTEQFYKLQKDHLVNIIQSDSLRVSSELQLFLSLVSWIEADKESRFCFASQLMEHVRFALLKPEDLVDHVASSFVMEPGSACRQYFDEALQYHLLPLRQPLLQTPRTQVRNKPCLVAFGGRQGKSIGYKHNSCHMYALHEQRWLPLPDTDSNFLYAAVATVDNFLYVCGGMGKPAHARASCYRFDPRVCTWTRLSNMLTRRQSFPLIAMNGKLYAFGGGTPEDLGYCHPPTAKSESYSIDKNLWEQIASLPESRKSASACVHEDCIYVSGGRTDDDNVLSMWRYQPKMNTYQPRAPMLLPHAGHAMVSSGKHIYIIDRSTVAIEKYSVEANQFTKVLPPLQALIGVARPTIHEDWVYYVSYVPEENGQEFYCARYNVVTLKNNALPMYPEKLHCVIGAFLAFPRHMLVDANNNP